MPQYAIDFQSVLCFVLLSHADPSAVITQQPSPSALIISSNAMHNLTPSVVIPRLNLTGLAPPIRGYGVAAAGESPATTTSSRTLSSYRVHRKTRSRGAARALKSSLEGPSSTSSLPSSSPTVAAVAPVNVLGGSTIKLSSNISDGTNREEDVGPCSSSEMYDCIVIATVILGGLFVHHSDREVPILMRPLAMLPCSSITHTPPSIALFLLALITKAKRVYGPEFLNAVSEAGREWMGDKFIQLLKLLVSELFSQWKSSVCTERLGTGTYSSIWRLAGSPDLAIKVISLPPIAEESIWPSYGSIQSDDERCSVAGEDDELLVSRLCSS